MFCNTNRVRKEFYTIKNKLFNAVILAIPLCSFVITNVFAAVNDSNSYSYEETSISNEFEVSMEYYIDDKNNLYVSGFSGDVIPDTVTIPAEIDGIKVV